MSGHTPEDIEREFRRFDTDGSGAIDESEFEALVLALGVKFDAGQLHTAFLAIDINGNRRIDFGEFKSWWSKRGA